MPIRVPTFVATLLAVLCLIACKPTVEGERREWASNTQAASEFEARWPGFAPVLASTKAEAEKLMKAAEEVNSDEARAEAMDAANKVLRPLVGKLRSVSTKLDELDAASRRLDRLRVESKDRRRIQDVEDAAAQVSTEVAKAMSEAAPENQDEALRILEAQIARLDRATKRCKDTFEQLSQPEGGKKN